MPPENQRWIAAGLRAGATPRNWLGAVATDRCDGRQGRSVGGPGGDRRAARRAGAHRRMRPASTTPAAPATVRQGPKTVLGSFGELHPRVLAALDLAGPVVAFQLDLDAVGDPKRRRKARARPAAVPADPPRLRLPGGQRGHRRCRAARRPRRRSRADHRRVAVRCLSGRAPAAGQEVAGDRGGVPAARTHADRCRDRGRQRRRWLPRWPRRPAPRCAERQRSVAPSMASAAERLQRCGIRVTGRLQMCAL